MSSCSDARRRTGRLLVLLAFFLSVGSLLAPSAQAHAVLDHSDPPAGAVLGGDPTTIRLWFNESIVAEYSSARLVDAQGRAVDGAQPVPGEDPQSLALSTPTLPAGTYGVLWQVLSQDDGHPTNGVLVFSVGAPGASLTPAALTNPGAGTSRGEVTLRWLAICMLAGVIGGLAFAGYVLVRARGLDDDPALRTAVGSARGRVLVLAAVSACGAVVVGLAALLQQASAVIPASSGGPSASAIVHLVASTRWGRLWLAQEALLLALAAVLVAMARVRRRPALGERWTSMAIAAWLALAVVAVQALGSHAAALAHDRTVAIVADAVHLATACLWMGGLAALIVVLWWRPSDAVDRRALARACRSPFSWLAASSACLVVATGLYGAGREVDTTSALASSGYGHTLIVKSLLLIVLVGLGAANAALLHGWRPRLRPSPTGVVKARASRRLVALEASVGIGLLLAAAVLSSSPPARGTSVAATAAPSVASVGGTVDDLVASMSITPDEPGVNAFTLVLASSRRPAPAPIDGVALTLTRAGHTQVVRLQETEPGRYFGTGTLGAAGRWNGVVVVDRAGATLNLPISWTVRPLGVPGPAIEGGEAGRPLAPWVDALAIVVLLGGAIAAIRARRVARRRVLETEADAARAADADAEHATGAEPAPGPEPEGARSVPALVAARRGQGEEGP